MRRSRPVFLHALLIAGMVASASTGAALALVSSQQPANATERRAPEQKVFGQKAVPQKTVAARGPAAAPAIEPTTPDGRKVRVVYPGPFASR